MNRFQRYNQLTSGAGGERTAAFSDAVFAIAMTLLAIDIRVPDVTSAGLAAAILGQWLQLAAYVLSFLVVGAYWMNHHRLFHLLKRCPPGFQRMNLLVLLFVGLVAYGTSVLAEYGDQAAAVILYAVIIACIGFVQVGLWRYAWGRGLLEEKLDKATFSYIALRTLVVPVVFAVSIPFALVNAGLAQYIWILALLAQGALWLVARAATRAPVTMD
jgi:uncharacterized membrane protein